MCSVIITIVAVVVAVRRCMCGCNIMLRLLLLLWLWLLAIVFFCCFNVGVCWVLFASCCFLLVGQLVGWSVGRFLGLCSYLSLRHFFLAVSLPAFLPSFLPAFLPSCLPAFLPSFLTSFLPSFLLSHTCLIVFWSFRFFLIRFNFFDLFLFFLILSASRSALHSGK